MSHVKLWPQKSPAKLRQYVPWLLSHGPGVAQRGPETAQGWPGHMPTTLAGTSRGQLTGPARVPRKGLLAKSTTNARAGIQLVCLPYNTFWTFSALAGLHMKMPKRHTQALWPRMKSKHLWWDFNFHINQLTCIQYNITFISYILMHEHVNLWWDFKSIWHSKCTYKFKVI